MFQVTSLTCKLHEVEPMCWFDASTALVRAIGSRTCDRQSLLCRVLPAIRSEKQREATSHLTNGHIGSFWTSSRRFPRVLSTEATIRWRGRNGQTSEARNEQDRERAITRPRRPAKSAVELTRRQLPCRGPRGRWAGDSRSRFD